MTDRRTWLALPAVLLCLASPAAAQSPVEATVREWIASIDASPDWTANYRGLIYDAATDTATLTGLTVKTDQPGVDVSIETIAIAGYSESHGGGIRAKSIKADGGTVEAGFMKFAIGDMELTDLAVPPLPGLAFDAEQPFTSMMRGYAEFLKVRLASGRIGSLDLVQQIEGTTTRASYGHVLIEGLADGRIASMRTGPLKMESPSPQGLVFMNIGALEARNMDLDAFVHVYNPDAYVDGKGDMVWRKAMELASYQNFEMQVPDAKITLAEMTIEDLKLRQPERSFAPFFDAVMANPGMSDADAGELAKQHLINLLSAFGFGRFGFAGLDVAAAGVDRMRVDSFHISDISIDGLGEFAIEGIDGAVQGQGAVKVGRFAFGGIAFPPIEVLQQAALSADGSAPAPDPKTLVPTLGFVEFLGISTAIAGMPEVALERFRFDLADYVGPIPTSLKVDMAGLDVPVALIQDREARRMFARLGYDRIVAAWAATLAWAAGSETVAVTNNAGIRGMGSVAIDASLGGIPRAAIENPEMLERVLPGVTLLKGAVTFTDDSIVGKGLDLLAEQMKAPPDKFRQTFADALPFLLSISVLNDPKLMALVQKSGLLAQLQPAVKQFIATPGSAITVDLKPPRPVKLVDIAGASQGTPDKLIEMLGLSVSGKQAVPAPAPVPSPAPAQTPK